MSTTADVTRPSLDADTDCSDATGDDEHPLARARRRWPSSTRLADHARLERWLRHNPHGAPIVWLARWVIGVSGETPARDCRLAERHCERYHDVTTQCGLQYVVPDGETETDTTGVLADATATERDSERRQYAEAEAATVLDSTGSGVSEHRDSSVATVNAAGALKRRRTFDTAGERSVLVGALGGKLAGEERGPSGGERTRINDVGRARGSSNRVDTACAGASALGYEDGVVVTATTDPARFESCGAAARSLVPDAKQLRRKLGYPPGVTCVEPTARGVGHVHVLLFGVERSDLPTDHELHRYWWETRERGQQVDVQPIVRDGETWVWADGDGPADAQGCPPGAYCAQAARSLPAVARLDAADVLAVADAYRVRGAQPVTDAVDAAVSAETGVNAVAVWQTAWYFGTGLKAVTRPSPELRDALAGTG